MEEYKELLVDNYQGGAIFVCRDKETGEPILFELIGKTGNDGVPNDLFINGKNIYKRLLIRRLNIVDESENGVM